LYDAAVKGGTRLFQTTGLRRLAGFFFFGLVTLGLSASLAASPISWDIASPIDWHLFRCTPPSNATRLSEAAAIHVEIQWNARYLISTSQGRVTGQVTNLTTINAMDPSKSWVVPSKQERWLLRHQQGHFDLNEAYRRKLETVLLEVTTTGRDADSVCTSLESLLHAAAHQVLSTLEDQQARYDAETSNGRNDSQQARWEGQIAYWLDNPSAAP